MSHSPSPKALIKQLDAVLCRDRFPLYRQLRELDRQPNAQKLEKTLERYTQSALQVSQRLASIPPLHYDTQLPIADKKEQIKAAIAQHQVVIIAGETGSGKTTQLPKICLELGLGARGLIGHTQPRRLAARSVATRIAEELHTPLGELVGYQVRFEDHSHDGSLIKLMTDGILLAETRNDRFLSRYDTLIIDEAHERSLNIDFLLGYLKQLLPKRPDLKVIVTSATIDLERFSKHFNDAPIIEVSGRTYPVETWYRPLLIESDDPEESVEEDLSVEQGILQALAEIAAHERAQSKLPGDVLVFLPGEREIRDCAEALRKAQLKHAEVLPLYARLSPSEQQKIFQPRPARKIVLATNVAETSLTVPGIRYVIDSGTARISRYSYRAKVQRLPVEPISQASANQRQGRCGRVEPGICIRLYSEDDYLARPEFTDPEILRTNLAAVILQMLNLRLGAIEQFPFIEPPESRAINDGFNLLQELSAVSKEGQLTQIGRQLAQLPIDPRLGRMLLEGANHNSLREVLIVTSALSVQDVRERPADRQQAADQAHAQWKDPDSDFAALINIWRGFEEQRLALGSNALRRWCRKNFLHYLRLREWRDAHRQLTLICRDLKLPFNDSAAEYAALHKALLSGLLSQIGQKTDDNDYLGARQRRFLIHPSSVIGRKKPKWIMAAELVETSKLFARMVAKIEPEWVEPLAEHLVKRNYLEPHWEKRRGQVVADEQVTLYGLIIIPRRPIHYGPIDPVISRELFIREGLVMGDIFSRAQCLTANRELLERLDKLEAKARRRDILADEEVLFNYYSQTVPQDIYQTASFDRWYNRESAKQPQLLLMQESDVLARDASEVTANQFPDKLTLGHLQLPLSYHFEPGHPRDGVTLTVPAPLLAQLPSERLPWLVPGMLEQRCIALVRNLPKAIRKNFVPVPDFVGAAVERLTFAEGNLYHALGHELLRMTGVRVSDEHWLAAEQQLDSHFRVNLAVVDAAGKLLGEERSLSSLLARFADVSQQALEVRRPESAKQAISGHAFSVKPTAKQKVAGMSLTVFPALVDEQGEVQENRFSTQAEADYQHRRALQRLLLQQLPEQAKYLRQKLSQQTQLALLYREFGRTEALIEDILLASVDRCLLAPLEQLPRNAEQLQQATEQYRANWTHTAEQLAQLVLRILQQQHELKKRLKGRIDLSVAFALTDIKNQLQTLIYPGFVRNTPYQWLEQYPRYLTAIAQRLDKVGSQAQRDKVWTLELQGYQEQLNKRAAQHQAEGKHDPELTLYRWMLEEYRVSLFAQQLGTQMPVSDKRLKKQWQAVMT